MTPSKSAEALVQWRKDLPETEFVLLSTCNRVELYAAGSHETPRTEELVTALAQFHRLAPGELNERIISLTDQQVAGHLLRVAASLDSMVVGEPQILSQVKEAYRIAQTHQVAGPRLHDLFQAALRTAKRVTGETALHRHRVSIPSVAIAELANCVFESFDDKQVLIAGAGDMAEETLRYLREVGNPHIHVVNRSPERGRELAAKWKGTFHPWEELFKQLALADLAISTTSATEPIMSAAEFSEANSSPPPPKATGYSRPCSPSRFRLCHWERIGRVSLLY